MVRQCGGPVRNYCLGWTAPPDRSGRAAPLPHRSVTCVAVAGAKNIGPSNAKSFTTTSAP